MVPLLAALAAGAARAPAATYYAAPVSTACSPTAPGAGTLANPYRHPYYALTQGAVQCGDTLQLRGGTYRAQYSGFADDSTPALRYDTCDNDDTANGFDGTHVLLPLFKACPDTAPLVIENYAGEDVILDGTDADMDGAGVWVRCSDGGNGPGGGNDSCCGTAGLSLQAPTETYCSTAFNVSGADTPQLWMDPAADTPGTRLAWWADNAAAQSSDAATDHDNLPRGGFFSVNSGQPLVVRLPDGSDPTTHRMKMAVQSGDGAYSVVGAMNASAMTLRRNASGGRLRVKYGYHPLYVINSQNITFDGVEVMAAGGRDYGNCLRTNSGDRIRFRNGLCRDAMAEGIAHYGGGPGGAFAPGIQLTNCTVERSTIYDTGRGWVDGGGKGTNLGMGIILKNCNDCVASGNTISETFRDGISVTTSTDGCGGTCTSDNAVIDGNTVFRTCRAADMSVYPPAQTGATDCACIQFEEQASGTIGGAAIVNNICRGDYAAPVVGVSPAGIKIDSTIENVKIVNNSLRNVAGPCIDLTPNGAPATVRNNAMDLCSQAGDACSGFPCDLFAAATVVPTHSHNTYWGATADTVVVRINPGGAYTRADVTASFEPTARQVAPLFVSVTDLHLRATSPLIGAGTPTDAPRTDVDGDSRPTSSTDLGADQVSAGPPNLISVTPMF